MGEDRKIMKLCCWIFEWAEFAGLVGVCGLCLEVIPSVFGFGGFGSSARFCRGLSMCLCGF